MNSLESIQYWFIENATSENVSAFGIIIVAIILVVSIYKMLKSFHPTMVVFVVGLLSCGLFLYWVHNRNEPEFMTPYVEVVSNFLPTKGPLREFESPR
jgi:hypothetical protein